MTNKKIKMVQYGTKHGHAQGVLEVILNHPNVNFVGVFEPDKKIRLSRFFQIINITKNQTVFTSNVDYACVSLINFKPVRMPEIYKNSYEVTCDV